MTQDLPEYLARGERARLFPVLADTSKEGRSTSITLSCLAHVREFAESLLGTVGQRIGKTGKLECYTEIAFPKGPDIKDVRPDGLIVLKVGNRQWRALVEAKVGNNELGADQVVSYLELAKANGIDAVITISNQFAATPSVHPVAAPAKLTSKVALFHWSWMHILTTADLLLSNEEVADEDQKVILNEMRRFLTHPSAGLKGFDSMPAAWTELVQAIADGSKFSAKSPVAQEAVGAWYEEVRDLSLILSRKIARSVDLKLPRAHAKSHEDRLKSDLEALIENHCLTVVLDIPDAASVITVTADVRAKSISASMRLRAPEDKQSTKARLNWLLRQIQAVEDVADLHVRLFWPGRGSYSQHSVAELRATPEKAGADKNGVVPHTFEVCVVRQLGGRFGQRKNFIVDLETIVPAFYENVGQRLKMWQASAPRVREERSESVGGIEHVREAAEEESRTEAAE